MRKSLQTIICFAITILAVWIISASIAWDKLIAAFFSFNGMAILALLLYTMLIRIPPALRLMTLLPISFPNAIRTIVLGCGLNNILPARAGEIGRIHFLVRELGISIPKTMRAIFWERLFDLNALLLVSCTAAILFENKYFSLPLIGIALVGWGILLIMHLYPSRTRRLLRLIPLRFMRMQGYRFLSHIRADMTLRIFLLLALTTLLTWVGYFGTTWLMIRMVASLPIPFSAVVVVFAAAHLTYAIPSAPGSLGVYEFAWVYALEAYRISTETAAAAGLFCHMSQFIPMTIIALAILARTHMGFLFIRKKQTESEATP